MANKDKMKEISEMLERGARDLFTTEQYTTYLRTMDKFHQYSFNNQVLIAAQKPDATLVAGYKSWEKNFNRHVKRGEKGIKIIAPMPVQQKFEQRIRDEQTGEYVINSDGTPQTEEVTRTIPRFRAVTVFDVSQTEGEPLPERPGAEMLTAKVSDYTDMMSAIRKVSPVPLRFEDELEGTANGYFDPAKKEIVIRAGMPESQTIKTAIHELTHARLHDPDRAGERKDQVTREVEAESAAFIICNHFGIDTSAYTFPYIAAWSSSVEMKELKASMDTIRHAASDIIDDLTERLEMEQTQEAVSFNQVPANHQLNLEEMTYEQVELFGIPVLFSTGHIEDHDVPEGFYRYNLRASDDDPEGLPFTVENTVAVNHAGTVLSPIRIPYLEHRDQLKIGDNLSFANSQAKTVKEFRKLWGDLKDYPNALQVMNSNILRANENLVWAGHDGPHASHENMYVIYQINRNDTPYKFMDMDFVNKHGMAVKAIDYGLVYGGSLSEIKEGMELDNLYRTFNADHPADYKGHSLSVSDVVILNRGDLLQAYYVDKVGFVPLSDFIQERLELAEAKTLINDFILREYENYGGADYSDPAHIPLAHSELEADGTHIQTYVNLVDYRIEKYLGKDLVTKEEYGNLRNMVDKGLKDMDFIDLVSIPTKEPTEFQKDDQQLNINCKKAIERSINENFDHKSSHLDTETAVRSVTNEYGADRVNYVLAVTVRLKGWDGRFSPETKQWAEELTKNEDFEKNGVDTRNAFIVDSHPALLDGLITYIRHPDVSCDMDQDKEIATFAEKLDKLSEAYDSYEYKDYVTGPEQHVQEITEQVQSGKTDGMKEWLQNVADTSDNPKEISEAKALAKDLNSIEGNGDRERIRTVYAPAYDNGKWKVTEIDLTQARWFGHTMEYRGIAYDQNREVYTTEEAAWKYINNDPTAYQDLVKFDDAHRPYLVTTKESEKISSKEMKDEPPKKRSIATRVKRNQGIIQKTQRQSLYREERSELSL